MTLTKTTQMIPFSPKLKIVNLEQLPRGTGARYLQVVQGEGDVLIAKVWRRKPCEGVLIDMKARK